MKNASLEKKEHQSNFRAPAQSASAGPGGMAIASRFGAVDPAGQVQRTNQTGLPDRLKSGAEALSGLSLDDVRVHFNSPKPAGVQALAYTQGTDIHVAPGQERHLPHEAWHVVQQKQGRVKPTRGLRGATINDNKSLENEADAMGQRSTIQRRVSPVRGTGASSDKWKPDNAPVVQRMVMRSEFMTWHETQSIPPNLKSVEDYDSHGTRDQFDTLLLIDVMKSRYGESVGKLPPDFVEEIYKDVNRELEGGISRKSILKWIAINEKYFGISPLKTETFDRSLAGIAESRQGKYHWDKSHDDFYGWLNSDQKSLPRAAKVNCWEAVLAAAVNAGALTKEHIKPTYIKLKVPIIPADNPDEPIWYDTSTVGELFSNAIAKFGAEDARQNKIKRGDVLVYDKKDDVLGFVPLYHVMIAVGEAQEDYHNVEVMSLWQQRACSFAREKLGALVRLGPGDRLRVYDFSG